jgi:hypothetical protein
MHIILTRLTGGLGKSQPLAHQYVDLSLILIGCKFKISIAKDKDKKESRFS